MPLLHGRTSPSGQATSTPSEVAIVVPSTPEKDGSGHPQGAGGLYHKLRALGLDRLAQLIIAIADLGDEDAAALIGAALAGAADMPMAAAHEEAEPYMVGASPAMNRVFASIRKFAATNAPLLITGESGTGKELVARAVHERSGNAKGPFVAINCAALPASLIAAELFGYEKGAFTGATQRRIGRLESANGGTIFLDEIADLPLELQTHLLRFLQEHTIDRVGGTRPITVDARVIVATNIELRRAIQSGRFREDLFYRLNVLNLHLPALRERGHDIELLATFFLRKFADEQGRTINGFNDEAWEKIRTHPWPGNVRELIACIRRAAVMAEGSWITPLDLGIDEQAPSIAMVPLALPARRRVIDEAVLRATLTQHGGNVTNAARALGVSRMTIYRLTERFGIR